MTTIQQFPDLLSANEIFKGNYGKHLRWAVLAALVLTCLFFWLMPRYEPTPYVLREQVIEIIDLEVPPVDEPVEQPVAAPPVVKNLEPVDDKKETPFELPNTFIFDPFPPPADPGISFDDTPFTPSSNNPRLLFQAKPEYSQIARMSGLEGTVIVKVLVGPQGEVQTAQIMQGAHPLLNQAAVRAAYKCRFQPGTQRHVPVRAWMAVPYRFRLR